MAVQEQEYGHRLVHDHTVYACVVGSRAYGLAGADSDTDRRGVYLAPTADFWRLDKPPTHVDGPVAEQFSWELERCCTLALQGNPTVLECLWSPIVEHVTDVGRELLSLRTAFLSQRVGATYGGYARDQLTRLDGVRRRTGQVRWKQAMHMMRLLLAGSHVLRSGAVLVDVSEHRDELLAVRRGDVPFAEFERRVAGLTDELGRALASTSLPVTPERDAISDFLFRVRRTSASEEWL